MSDPRKSGFARRPGDPEAWVRAAEKPAPEPAAFTARLTIDVTPAMRGRLKITAFRRGQTVADMIRALLDREFPDDGSAS
ncbi:ribbon-helix-helix protein [Sphingomonas sp. DC1600-2]|uniref:ribbon-helix-helix protein n=1 Tax=unclassified Sphingomonas TaxID=196159 RepID=UPI003CF47FA8